MAKKKAAKKKVAKKKLSLADRLKEAKRAFEKAKRDSVKVGERLFRECVSELFDEHPDLQSFQWNQYAPHWNDGDECVFGVYWDSLSVNGEEEPECLYTLENLNGLLSDKNKSETRIVMELSDTKKDKWEIERLKRDLESLNTRDPEEVASKYRMKKAISELLSDIDDSVYEDMFGEGTVVVTREGISVEQCEHD
jgi:hypothetical protein